MKEENPEAFWFNLWKILEEEANDAEQTAHHKFLLEKPELMDSYIFLKSHWHVIKRLEDFSHFHSESDWTKVQSRIKTVREASAVPPKVFSLGAMLRKAMPYAAAVTLLFTILYWVFTLPGNFREPRLSMTSFEAPLGSRAKVVLPDGSDVWINAGSMIQYYNDFNKNSRTVRLIGEAFFDVKKQELPFIVTTSEINIHVMGTSFSVKAYAEDEVIETTLVSGSLRIEKAAEIGPSFDDIILRPSQKATFYRSRGQVAVNMYNESEEGVVTINEEMIPAPSALSRINVVTKKDVSSEVSWKDGVLIFDIEPLGQLVRKLERRYNVEFIFEEEHLKDINYTGRLRELSLEQVLHAMRLTSPIDYYIIDKQVTLKYNKDLSHKYLDVTNQPK